jgi:hypothetical protein
MFYLHDVVKKSGGIYRSSLWSSRELRLLVVNRFFTNHKGYPLPGSGRNKQSYCGPVTEVSWPEVTAVLDGSSMVTIWNRCWDVQPLEVSVETLDALRSAFFQDQLFFSQNPVEGAIFEIDLVSRKIYRLEEPTQGKFSIANHALLNLPITQNPRWMSELKYNVSHWRAARSVIEDIVRATAPCLPEFLNDPDYTGLDRLWNYLGGSVSRCSEKEIWGQISQVDNVLVISENVPNHSFISEPACLVQSHRRMIDSYLLPYPLCNFVAILPGQLFGREYLEYPHLVHLPHSSYFGIAHPRMLP